MRTLSRRQSVRARAALGAAVETLESRRMLCGLPHDQLAPVPAAFDWGIEQEFADSQLQGDGLQSVGIIWTNRGQASDGFAAAFGNSANAGRAVVDAVFTQWGRIIASFNRSDFTTTLQVSLNISGNSGFGAAGGPEAFPPADHKPRLGSITINRGTITPDVNDSNGWFFDPTPMDNAEFMGNINNAYNAAATNTSQGSDFFSVVGLELAHCLGMISDVNNSAGNYGDYTLEDFSDITNIRDNAEGGGNFGFYQVFNGPNIDHLMTSYNSGDATSLSWGNVIHTSGGGSINFNGTNWVGTQDDSNALYNGAERVMPSFVVARILGDAYNYTIIDPATFATAHTVLNQSTGVLTIRGSSSSTSSDLLVVDVSGSDLVVTVDIGEDVPGSGALPGAGNLPAYVTRIPLSSFTSISMLGGGGNDFMRVERNGGKLTLVDGQAGNDFIDFGIYNRNLSNQTGNVIANGGDGSDQIFVYDDVVSTARTFTITDARFDRSGWGGFFYGSDIEALTLTTGLGADVVNVQSTYVNQPVFLTTVGGNDIVNVGSTNGIQSVAGKVTVSNPPSFTTLNINDTGSATPQTADVDFEGSATFGRLDNLGPAKIIWKTSDIAGVNIITGSGDDSLTIRSNSEVMGINSAGGRDRVQIGDASVGGLQAITGAITVNNTPASTDLFISDAGSNVAKNANMDFAGANTFGRITNLAPVPLVWYNLKMATVNIITGNADDSILVYSNNTGSLNFNSSGGADTLRFGAQSVGGTQFISGLVTVDNDNGMSTVFIDDLGAANTKPNVSIDHPNGNHTGVSGMAPGIIRFNDDSTTFADIRTSGPASGVLNNKVTVLASAAPLRIGNNGSLGDVILGAGAQGASAITAPVHVFGPASFTAVQFNDSTGTVPRTVTLDDDTVTATVTGFGPADHTFLISSVFNSYFTTGPLADVFNVYSARKQVNYRNLVAGSPTDQVVVGSPATGLANVVANISTVNITVSPVSVYLEDSVDTVGRTFTFAPQASSNRIVFNGTNFVEHYIDARCEAVSINAGSGNDTFNVPYVRPATYLYGNDGADAYNLGTNATLFSNPIYLYGPGGLDTLNVNAEGGSTASAVLTSTMHFSSVVLGTGGSLSVAGGGDKVLSTRNLTLGSNSTIDLVDNDMILDYTGATQAPTVQALINAMRNGGAWNGTRGITSSFAATSTPANNTLGVMEASEFESIYGAGALFSGEALDADMVLVKHTYYGDADFNGEVNFDDYSRTDAGFNFGRTGWLNGDYDGNGVVNFDDYSLLDLAFNTQGSTLRSRR